MPQEVWRFKVIGPYLRDSIRQHAQFDLLRLRVLPLLVVEHQLHDVGHQLLEQPVSLLPHVLLDLLVEGLVLLHHGQLLVLLQGVVVQDLFLIEDVLAEPEVPLFDVVEELLEYQSLG